MNHSRDGLSTDAGKLYAKQCYHRQVSLASQDSDPQHYSGDNDHQSMPIESSSLGRGTKDTILRVPCGTEGLASPGSLSDLRMSADNVCSSTSNHQRQGKMPSSLSLQTELPLQAANNQHQYPQPNQPTHHYKGSINGITESSSRQSLTTPPDLRAAVHRTVSVGSEALSEAFFSADEEQV